MCLYSQIRQNKKYTKTKKNGGVIPAILDLRVTAVPVACGECIECRQQKKREWQVRLLEDVRHNTNGIFVTLTFSNESITKLKRKVHQKQGKGIQGYTLDNEIATLAVRYFMERWRKEYKKSVRHWLVTELGHNGTENIHLHGIIWTNEPVSKIKQHWKYGYIYPKSEYEIQQNYVSERTVNYITKYISKRDELHKEYKSIILTSAGIGKDYINRPDAKLNRYKKGETKKTYTTRTGHEMALTKYWKNHLYTDEEKEALWIEKLDEQTRWVCGDKIDISENEEDYYKTLEFHRRRNTQLGYGSNTKDWSRKKYEEERRNLMMQKRTEEIEKANTLEWPNQATP